MIDSPPSLEGGQEVQTAAFLRASASKTFARGNEFHTLEWTASEPLTSVQAATDSVLNHTENIPRDTADVVIIIDGTDARYIIKDATVESWSSTWDNKRESKTITISGGLIQDPTEAQNSGITTVTGDSAVFASDTF